MRVSSQAWLYNSDGLVTGNNGIIRNSYLRCNDDSIKLYSDGMRVSNLVIWQVSALFVMWSA
jgi:hypothetical protein